MGSTIGPKRNLRRSTPRRWVGRGCRQAFTFALLLIGFLEGIDPERGIAWRADSFALRDVLGIGLEDPPPDHSTISRTRRLIDLETHRAVFTWVLQCLSTAGLVKGKTIGGRQERWRTAMLEKGWL
jgi:hypothetical protein